MRRKLGMVAIGLACAAVCVSGQVDSKQTGNASASKGPATADAGKVALEPPGAIYRDAMRPLDSVRSSLDNWSEAELGSLAVGIHRAQVACAQAKPEDYTGDDLYDFAHLCSFGQVWPAADDAATSYIASGADAYRAQAYALKISALVHLNDADGAVKTSEEMLGKLPYDAEVAYAMHYLEDDLDKAWNLLVVKLESEEHPKLVAALQQGTDLKAAHSPATLSMGALFEAGMRLACLQRYSGDEAAAELTSSELKQALGTATLTPGDQASIAAALTRFDMLDQPIPSFSAKHAVTPGGAVSSIRSGFGKGTVFVLFPDWCVQCRKMMKSLGAFAAANAAVPVYAYGLIFHEGPVESTKTAAVKQLDETRGTPTALVDAAVAAQWGATDFPYAVVTDGRGVVQFAGTVPTDAFKGDGYIQRVIERMFTVAASRQLEDGTH
jgi:thiol-disulfide isomerase/thioredoxin